MLLYMWGGNIFMKNKKILSILSIISVLTVTLIS